MSLRYILVTPAHNEAADIEKTIQSVIAQTVLPERWIIVSDGSTDSTGEIVRHYLEDHAWMELIERPPRQERHFAAKVDAFNAGLERIGELEYDVIGNIDGDVSFDADYMEFLLERFSENPALGVAGTHYIEGEFHGLGSNFINPRHANGQRQFFRRECFERIGGYVAKTDVAIVLMAVTGARSQVCETHSLSERTYDYHRPKVTGEESTIDARIDYGNKVNFLGISPL